MSTGSTGHRSLPTTPTERKSSASQNGVKSNAIKGPKSSPVTEKTKGKQTPPTSRRENKSLIKTKELADTKANKNIEKERKLKHQDEKDKASKNEQIKEGVLNICEDSVGNGQLNENVSENSDGIDDVSSTRDISSPEGRFSPMLTINGGRKTSECSLETDSDVNSDLFSDMTDTDYDFRSQRYSGLSETSSDISFGTSPAWKLFHSVELDKNAPEPESSELGSSLKDCLMNLNLQGSVTPTMKRRIFDAAPTRNPKEKLPDSAMDSETPPMDKAVFFDVEHYNDKSPNEEDDLVGSPRKWSLVKSLISSIEKRSSNSTAAGKATKNAATISRASAPGSASKHHGIDESASSTQKTTSNHETPRARPLPLNEHFEDEFVQGVMAGPGLRTPSPDGELALPLESVIYDFNKNVSISNPRESDETSTYSRRIPGEKPLESFESINHDVKARKSSLETRRKEKELDVFPRPQRQFTLEEMIQDMMPGDGESKDTGDQRTLSPEPRFQAWL